MKHTVKYLWSAAQYSRCCSQFPVRCDLILKASAAERSLALLIMKQQHLFIMQFFAGSRLSILWLTMPLLFGWQWATPGLQRYIEVSASICQARRPTKREKKNICPAHLHKPIHERAICCWRDGKCLLSFAVSVHWEGIQRNRYPLPYHCLNSVWRKKSIR